MASWRHNRFDRSISPEAGHTAWQCCTGSGAGGESERDALGVENQDSAVGALFTLVSDRRCQVVPEVLAAVEGSLRGIGIPISGQVDLALGSPMPSWEDLDQELRLTLARIASLEDDDAWTISAAMHMHYCAAVLASSDFTGAYAFVVGGLEVLAQRYGSPPSDWADWDRAASWDAFMAEQQLTNDQSAALRDRSAHAAGRDVRDIRLGAATGDILR